MLRVLLILLAIAVVLVVGVYAYYEVFMNPRIARELAAEPDGERAHKVMLLTLPSGRALPMNYLREGDIVYAGADGRWWHELRGGEYAVTLLVRGETLAGHARAVEDDPEHTKDVFSRLRPKALPGFGTLVEIRLDAGTASDARSAR